MHKSVHTSGVADASDSKPLSKMETQEAKAACDAAKAKWDKMTPEEQAVQTTARSTKTQEELTAFDEIATAKEPGP